MFVILTSLSFFAFITQLVAKTLKKSYDDAATLDAILNILEYLDLFKGSNITSAWNLIGYYFIIIIRPHRPYYVRFG